VPWKETCSMDERLKFVGMYLTHEWSVASLCREFGISRKTGYKLLSRYFEEDLAGLEERSRTPHHHPHAVSSEVEAQVLTARQAHPRWGARKLRVWLERQRPGVSWPVASTINEVLRRHGLTVPRRRSRRSPAYTEPFVHCSGANLVWSADLKGWFCTGDGRRCDPLTITDNYSRYLLRCQVVRPADYQMIRPVFEAAFREYGLPTAIRTDNGAPFATTTVGGLSRLSIWWIKLGIRPERIAPGKPAQNGRHERMHRTLKAETASPPQRSWRSQQAAFDRFRTEYNYQRPHQAIDYQTPASRYQPSLRPYPLCEPEIQYPADMELRWVKAQGDIWWCRRHVYLSETLGGELVGLRQVSDRLWDVYFGPVRLAQLDQVTRQLVPLPITSKTKHETK
jgi:putative transposase